MTSSNPPHFTLSLTRTRSISPRCLAHLPLSSLSRPPSFPTTRTLPHTTSLSLVLPHERVLPTYILSPYPSSPSQPPASSSTIPLYSGNSLVPCLSSCHLLLRPSFFHFPPFVPTNYRRAQFRWIKAATAYYRRPVVPTTHGYRLTVMLANCDTGGMGPFADYTRNVDKPERGEKNILTRCNAHGTKYEDVYFELHAARVSR